MEDARQRIIREFRANGGHCGGYFADIPLLLLTTVGARSGRSHTTPLAYLGAGGRYVVLAANAGAARHPDWYHNLAAHPDVTVEVGTATLAAAAVEVTGGERGTLFGAFTRRHPQAAGYRSRTTRPIPVIALTPA